jgi:hypothetical protein
MSMSAILRVSPRGEQGEYISPALRKEALQAVGVHQRTGDEKVRKLNVQP